MRERAKKLKAGGSPTAETTWGLTAPQALRALEELGQGFLEDAHARRSDLEAWRQREAPGSDAEEYITPASFLGDIHRATLTLTYRLLFILYAEGRRLLPLDDESYRELLSLERVRDQVAAAAAGESFGVSETALWERLSRLFEAVGEGRADLIPAYDGGLFDREAHEFLGWFKVGDRRLARAIDLLSRARAPRCAKWEKIDYGALDIRRLGDIYEGILDHRPQVARREHDGDRSRGGAEAGQYRLVAGGEISRRKSSGSYYTPERLVRHIVESTLGPLVRGESCPGPATPGTLFKPGGGAEPRGGGLRPLTSEEILELKVLDPAAGSGHFLLAATEYLADAYAAALTREGKGCSGAGAAESGVGHRRLVAERCIYGLDVNPMAVQLAKLSLWLLTMDRARPLSFLNHRLKVGNALVGAWVEQLGERSEPGARVGSKRRRARQASGTLNLFELRFREQLPRMVRRMAEISSRETRSQDDVRLKKSIASEVEGARQPFVNLADVWVGAYFGEAADDYPNLLVDTELARGRGSNAARRNKAFHWELEFPEVFFDADGNRCGGFDAVIGNPPYLSFSGRQRVAGYDGVLKIYEASGVAAGWATSHGLFMLRALDLLRPAGLVSMIVPDQVGHLHGYGQTRAAFLRRADLIEVRYRGEDVFRGVTTPSLTFVAAKRGAPDEQQAGPARVVLRDGSTVALAPRGAEEWYAAPRERLYERARAAHAPIETFSDPGVHTGNVSAKLVLDCPVEGALPVLEGRQVHPFRCDAPAAWLNVNYRAAPGEYFRISPFEVYGDTDIVLRQTASRPVAARHTHRCHFRNSVLALRAPDGYSVEYLLGVLNSRTVAALYSAATAEAHQRAFPQIKVGALKRLPLPDPRAAGRESLVTKIEEGVRGLEACGGDEARAEFAAGMRRLDELVDDLYRLGA